MFLNRQIVDYPEVWTIVDYCGLLWTILDYCGLLWTIVDYCGLLWTIQECGLHDFQANVTSIV